MQNDGPIPKAPPQHNLGRHREVVSDPTNLLIERDKWAGFVRDGTLVLHNGNRVPLEGRGSYYDTFGYILVIPGCARAARGILFPGDAQGHGGAF